jgi:hypothetical protein
VTTFEHEWAAPTTAIDDFEVDDADVDGPTLDDNYRELAKLREEDLRLKREYEDAHSAYLRKRAQVYDRMEDEGVASTKLPGVGHFIRNEPSWKPTIQDKRALLAWAADNSPALLNTELAKGLLNQLVSERMRDGTKLPPGLGAYPDKVVSIRKA